MPVLSRLRDFAPGPMPAVDYDLACCQKSPAAVHRRKSQPDPANRARRIEGSPLRRRSSLPRFLITGHQPQDTTGAIDDRYVNFILRRPLISPVHPHQRQYF